MAGSLPGALVTRLRERGRKPAPRYQKTIEFRDPEGKLRVATRENFVGRRRQLQNCLRAFKMDEFNYAYELALRQTKAELSKDNLFYQLEEYLCQGDWVKAVSLSALIFFEVMALENIQRDYIYEKIPCQILNKIDRLWIKHSNGKFGFSIQKKINQNLNVEEKYNESIGWVQREMSVNMEKIIFNLDEADTNGFFPSWNLLHLIEGWSNIYWGGIESAIEKWQNTLLLRTDL
ncbi:GUN4 domain-containing protein [Dapis sp. BLCC M229]|uniref:GUN4 domain-containing protein n=1 Tax=Dapis sp. BLCC M229 TaxID=3400188 RepID=UPI003CEB5511